MAAKKTTKEVTKTEESAVAVSDYGNFAGQGFENQDSSDVLVPFLRLLQGLSPAVKPVAKGGIENAEVGMLMNSVTQDLFTGEEGVSFVGSTTDHVVNEWQKRADGGAFIGTHQLDSQIFTDAKKRAEETGAKFGKYETEDDHDLIETFYIYGVLCPEGGAPQPIIVDFTSTKIKVYKKWMSRLRTFLVENPNGGRLCPPMFATLCRIRSIEQTNKDGDFYNLDIRPEGADLKASLLAPDDERFIAAMDMRAMVESGTARADMKSGSDDAEAEGGATDENGNPIPF